VTAVRDPQFNGRLGKVRLGRKVVETLGWRWVATRLFLEAERRSGALERRTPLTRWSDWQLEGAATIRPAPLYPTSAGAFLHQHHPEVEADLRERLEQLKERRFDIFGTVCRLDSWHEEPLSPASYPARTHWSKVPELPDADLKLIWEPSRFSWVYDLARLHALDPTTAAPDVFWSLFEDWCEANQPNAGINWQCGQEAALRLMAVLFGVFTFSGASAELSDDRERLLACFADATAERIMSHWRYAKSQDNNHIVSEAVGLITVGLVFPGLAVADRARALGERLLDDSCRRLVFPDGGTSQYSLNYHRVFMDNFSWALWLHRSFGEQPPAELEPALRRTRDFLVTITQKSDGAAGNWGNNDGALLFPLAATRHLDVRPTLLLATQLLDGATYEWGGPAEEAARWFWGDAVRFLPSEAEPEGVWSKVFPYAGISIIVNGKHRAMIRGGEHQLFRPPQCDFGHVELWVDGEQTVFDPGTYSYKPKPGEPDYSETRWHNMPWPEGEQMMTRLGRFLWADAPETSIASIGGEVVRFARPPQIPAERIVQARSDGWTVADHCASRSRCGFCGSLYVGSHDHDVTAGTWDPLPGLGSYRNLLGSHNLSLSKGEP